MWQFVDLGEAAGRLRGHPEINEVAAVRAPGGHLYVLVEPQGMVYGTVLRDIVLDEIETRHPGTAIAMVRDIPRLDGGGVDPEAVTAFGRRAVERGRWIFAIEPAETDEEKAVAEILSQMLGLRRLSVTDSLPLIGVDSLVLVELSSAISERFGVTLDAMELFDADTVRELARSISRRPS